MSVHINSTDTVYLVFDSPPIVIDNENGESFLRIVGTIENYQALNTAWGQITEIDYFSFRVKNSDYNTASEAYSISLQERNPIDDNALGEKLDLTIKIPDYIPFGTIPHSDMNAVISFENYNNMYVDIPNTDSTDRPGPSDGDNTPPNLLPLEILWYRRATHLPCEKKLCGCKYLPLCPKFRLSIYPHHLQLSTLCARIAHCVSCFS